MFPVICLGIYHQNGNLEKYIVFSGNHTIKDADIFSTEELENIHNQSITIQYSTTPIHPDDSIYLIKQKILRELQLLNLPLRLEEIYLFFKQNQILSPFSVFESIIHSKIHPPNSTAPNPEKESEGTEEMGKEEITAIELGQLLTNYGLNLTPELEERIRHSIEFPDEIVTFSYEDWKTTWPWNNEVSKFQPLGLQYAAFGKEPLLSAHPFFLHYEFLKIQIPSAMNTTERELIMNFIPEMAIDSTTPTPKIVNLYMASAESVLEHFQTKTNQDIGENGKKIEEELIALFFPHLFHTHKIHSYDDWKQYHSESETSHHQTDDVSSAMDVVYDIYNQIPKLPMDRVDKIGGMYLKKGIRYFLFSIPSNLLEKTIQVPLEYLFRQCTATKNIPYIQYNPGYKQEILYRLYSEKMAQNGKKIPYLDKDVLKRWSKQVRNKQKTFITFSITPIQSQEPELPRETRKTRESPSTTNRASFKRKYMKKWSGELFLRIYANGEIEMEGKPTDGWNEYSLEILLLDTMSPILQILNRLLQSTGYTLPTLKSWLPILNSEEDIFTKEIVVKEKMHLKVVDMTYQWELKRSDQLLKQMEEKREWLSSMFYYTLDWKDETTVQKKGGPVLTFKRVENFQSMETENQWVAYYAQQKYSETQILEKLQTEHGLSREGAVGIYSKYLQEFQNEQRNQEMNIPGRGWKRGHRQIRVKNTNPGFPVVFQFGIDDCLITAENICDFTYLNTLQIYIHFLYELSKGLPDSVGKRLGSEIMPIPESLPITFASDKELVIEDGQEKDSDLVDMDMDTDVEIEPEYLGTDYVEKNPEYLHPETPEEPVPEEDAVESESEETSISSDLSELHYEQFEEEDADDDENHNGNKGGKHHRKKTLPKKSQKKLESQILSFIKSSMTPSSTQQKSGAIPEPQFKNQNVSKYWVEKMKKRDPGLFEIYATKEKEIPNFKAYPRTCQINDQRQPILIDKEEKQRIDQEHPGSYTYALPFKSSEDAPEMYYICPRYWCFKTGTSMTEEEVQQGKCGPPGNSVPSNFTASEATKNKDTSLVHFNDKKQHRDPKGNYVQNNPGFIKRDGVCMPCCFKRARPEVSCEESRQVGEYTTNDYIITDETKRLEPMKWGFLPIAIQNYFHYFPNLKELMDGKRLKLDKPMLLRYGVEQYPNQSFLGVMADWYSSVHKLEDTVTVEEMREILSTAITLDQFLQYNNGSLVTAFRATAAKIQSAEFPSKTPALITSSFSSSQTEIPKRKSTTAMGEFVFPEEVDYTETKYTSSLFIQRLKPTEDPKRLQIINDAIASYENFLLFLKNPASEIDPTYLWDIISQPNAKLFPKGYNLVLLSLPENDITQNVDLICPSMVYSSQIFDVNKESALVLLHNGFYEPIYVLKRTDKENEQTTKFFLSKNSSVLNGIIQQTMKLIRETTQNQCSPKTSMKNYTFERPIYLTDLVASLKKLAATYRITGHIWNYSGKIIGLQVAPYPQSETTSKSVMVPCFPTAHSPLSSKHEANQSHRFIDEQGLWMDFPMTLQILRKLNKDSMTAIPCMPVIEVVEEQMVVGILTQTNQFVAIQPPVAYQPTAPPSTAASTAAAKPLEKDLNTQLMVLHSTNMIQADIELSMAPQSDPERERWTRDIRLENNFYMIFRSTARLFINKYESRPIRKAMMGKIQKYNQGRIKYRDVLNELVEKLQTLLKENVSFVVFEEEVLAQLYAMSREQNFTPCIQDSDSLNPSNQPYCLYSEQPAVIQPAQTQPAPEPAAQPAQTQTQKGGGGNGKLLLPKQNRVNESADNETGYYLRLADELLRFPQIQSYLLFPSSYLMAQSSEYKIKPTEIILLQSVLNPENVIDNDYFKNLMPLANKRESMPYEFSEPMNSELYSNLVSGIPPPPPSSKKAISRKIDDENPPENEMEDISPISEAQSTSSMQQEMIEQQRMIQEYQTFYTKCENQTIPVIGSVNNSIWKRMFPKNTKEIVYHGTTENQSFCCIMNIIHSYLKRPLSLNEMKKQLVESYRPWMNSASMETKKKIMKIVGNYNPLLVRQWKASSNQANWENMFFNETYIFTELDFWVVANDLQLPVIIFTANRLKHLFKYNPTAPSIQWILVYPHRSKEGHYFIRIPSEIESGNLAPKYSRIQSSFVLDDLKNGGLSMGQQIQDGLENPAQSPYAQNVISLEAFLGSP